MKFNFCQIALVLLICFMFAIDCDSCDELYEGECPTHGPYIKINNTLAKVVCTITIWLYTIIVSTAMWSGKLIPLSLTQACIAAFLQYQLYLYECHKSSCLNN